MLYIHMIVKVYNDLETKLISKILGNDEQQIREEYTEDGLLYMRHLIRNNIIYKSYKFNKYGDIISFGNYSNNQLHGSGCTYNHARHQWIKSPHFQNGSVFGLATVYDVNHEIIFFGWMFNDEMVREEHVYHPYLQEEYMTVKKHEKQDENMMKEIYSILDGEKDVFPVKL